MAVRGFARRHRDGDLEVAGNITLVVGGTATFQAEQLRLRDAAGRRLWVTGGGLDATGSVVITIGESSGAPDRVEAPGTLRKSGSGTLRTG